MPVYRRSVDLPVSATDALAWHQRPGAFERMTPPWEPAEVLAREAPDGPTAPGATLTLRVSLLGVPTRLRVRHEALDEPGVLGFVDVQDEGPFAAWRHVHRLVPTGPGRCRLEDEITWEAPWGAPTTVAAWVATPRFDRLFGFRHRRLVADLSHHAPWADTPRRTIAVSGASGLVGGHLVPFLTAGGHRVRRLVRRAAQADDIAWDPAAGTVDRVALADCDTVIHLAGEPISGRWTAEKKHRIRASRVDGTRTLAEALAALGGARTFVSCSAVGVYGGTRGDAPQTESDPPGTDFLAEVAVAWEAAADAARAAGVRVVHPRVGIVMSGTGGALPLQVAPAAWGLGGPIGGGSQWISWIALDDLLGILLWCALSPELAGPVNATAPEPVPQAAFAARLGAVLGRPAFAPLPAALVRLASGEAGQAILLEGQRVVPERLLKAGFSFAFPTLEAALRHELGR